MSRIERFDRIAGSAAFAYRSVLVKLGATGLAKLRAAGWRAVGPPAPADWRLLAAPGEEAPWQETR